MVEPFSDSTDTSRASDEVFCRDCGERISARAELCPECGIRQLPPPKSSFESTLDDLVEGGNPFVAAALSALFPGLGQLYNRELKKALAFIVGSILAVLSVVVVVGVVLYPAVWVYSIYDAYRTAEREVGEDGPDSDADGPTRGVNTRKSDD